MTVDPIYFEQEELLEGKTQSFFSFLYIQLFLLDFRFEPYISHLRNGDISLPSTTTTNNIDTAVGDLMSLPP